MQPNAQNWDPTWGHSMTESSVNLPKLENDLSIYAERKLGNLTAERAQRDLEALRRELTANEYED